MKAWPGPQLAAQSPLLLGDLEIADQYGLIGPRLAARLFEVMKVFIDQAKILAKGGDGGNGMVAFRREAHTPEGGPWGGNGGRGGSIIARVDTGLQTLIDFRYRRRYLADHGENGGIKDMHGRNAEDLIFKVPPGTLIRDAVTNEIIADLTEVGQQAIVARGGRGGRGNAHFRSSTNRVPQMAEKGEPGREREIILELKLIASVGLVGFPNAGKSTLLARVSAARPKIADYPFTTLHPNLGVVTPGDRSFVMADIPGLIEGAHEGVGLGHDFLRHIERTKLLLHIIDTAGIDGRDPVEDYDKINHELRLYSPDLGERVQIVALNKMDLPEAQENLPRVQEHLTSQGVQYFVISAATGAGVEQLMHRVADRLAEIPDLPPIVFTDEALHTFSDDSHFEVRVEDGVFLVEGQRLHRFVAMTDFENDAAVKRIQNIMRKMGVEDALREHGVKPGDTVRIRNMEFTYAEHDDVE